MLSSSFCEVKVVYVLGRCVVQGGGEQQERDCQVVVCSNSPLGNDLVYHISLGIPPVRVAVPTLLSCAAVTASEKFSAGGPWY